MEMCRWPFQGFTEIPNGRHRAILIFWGAQKLKKLVFEILTSHSLQHGDVQVILSRCYQNWKWLPEVHSKFFVGAKTQNLSGKLFKFYYHIPHDIRMCKWFFKVLLKFKMVAMDKLHIFVCAKTWKIEVCNNSHFTITLPTIWKCASDFTEIRSGHHKSTF